MKIEKSTTGGIIIKDGDGAIQHVIKARELFFQRHPRHENVMLISNTPTAQDTEESININVDKVSEVDGTPFSGDRDALLVALDGLFKSGGVSGEGLKDVDAHINRLIFSGATIYQNIFEARDAGVAIKVGNPTYDDTTHHSSNRWKGREIIRFGSNNEADGNGMLVTMPTDKEVLWIRFIGDRWNVVKVYDDKGKQFGLWAAGWRNNNAIAPDGAGEDSYYDAHQWIPINVKGHSGKIYVISKPNTSNNCWISGVAWSDNPLGLAWCQSIALHWAINGGDGIGWYNNQWRYDNLANIPANSFRTLKVPVVENGENKLLFINLHGNNWNEGGHVAVHVNGTKLDDRLSEQWTNSFFRQRMSNMYNHIFAVKVPQNLIPSGATFLDIQIDTRTHLNKVLNFRELGTLNL